MKVFTSVCVVAALVAGATLVRADDELKSGPQPGQPIKAFNVIKVAGADSDGVDKGETLCYRCKYGSRPMVMVFARGTDEKLTSLVKELDEAVSKNKDKKLAAFVNIVGEDKDAAEKDAKTLASASSPTNVPIVVPEEAQNGPDNYGINPKAGLTVIVAFEGKVESSRAYANLDSADVKAILADVSKSVQ
jgi:hypothetical protein